MSAGARPPGTATVVELSGPPGAALGTYSRAKIEIAAGLEKLETIAAGGRVRSAARSVREKLEAEVFSLVVVGQFKRGKTTFINALLGMDLLPTAIIPLTSIITILRYGEELRINAFFEDGTEKTIELAELPFYVTERHNPGNEKGVDRVEIACSSEYLRNGVRIVDTPGIASVHDHNTRTTYAYLPRADAAIFLVSVDPPLTRAELHFLRDLRGAVSRTFFIQNKIDTVSESDREESLAFSRQIIENEAGFDSVRVYPLSAKAALQGKMKSNPEQLAKSGLPEFERTLGRFLMNNKGQVLLDSTAKKAVALADEEIALAELEEKSLRLPLEELENKIGSFKAFISEVDQEKADSVLLMAGEIRTLQRETLEHDLKTLRQDKTKWLVDEVRKFALEHRADSNGRFADGLDLFIATEITDLFDAWRAAEEKMLAEKLEPVLGRFTSRLNGILDQIMQSTTELFGISCHRFRMEEILPQEVEFRFETHDESFMLSSALGLARRSLPRALAHKLILKEACNKAVMLVDRHCGKTRYDFAQRMEKLVADYRSRLSETVAAVQDDVLRALEIGTRTRRDAADEVSRREASLRGQLEALKALKESFRKVGEAHGRP